MKKRSRKFKKKRRGKHNNKKNNKNLRDDLTLLHSNIRGLKSKINSLTTNANVLEANFICLNEHHITGNNIVNIKGYKSFSRNRCNKQMGGVSVSVDPKNEPFTVKIKVGEGDDEFLIVKNDRFDPPINIMSVYGETESRTTKGEIYEKWMRLEAAIHDILSKNEEIIVMGDFNKKVGNDHQGIKGNHPEISVGGHLVRDVVDSGALVLVNNLEKCHGGPYTRFDLILLNTLWTLRLKVWENTKWQESHHKTMNLRLLPQIIIQLSLG